MCSAHNHAANVGTHSYAARGADVYQTPAVAVHALLRVEQLPPRVWECACGPGAIVSVLRDAGHYVIATDLLEWHCPDSKAGVDFLIQAHAPAGIEAVVTNPPFRLANQFVVHALELAPRAIMLLRLAFLESECRTKILDGGQLARVHVFKHRLPMMHRHDWAGRRASSSIPFAWFVWDRNHRGPTTVDRI
jgi:hypothetical protein